MHETRYASKAVALGVITTLALAACGNAAPASQADSGGVAVEVKAPTPGRYIDITAEQLREMMTAKAASDFVLINVHTPYAGEIDGTDLSIPYNEIGHRTGEVPGGKDARIVLYCRSGHMSSKAAEALVSLGYTNVYNLVGGMQAWEAAGT